MSQSQVTIIGAGPAGLTAGYELTKLGYHPIIVEADQHVGGISRTVNYQGFRFDIGGHRFFSKIPQINTLWHEILGEDFLVRPRLSRIHYDGKFFDYPLKAFNALSGLGPMEALLVGLSYTKARLFPCAEESTFEQWVSNRFGRRLYEIFFRTYTEKVWGMSCTEISAEWASQRIKNLSLGEALRNAFLSGGRTQGGEVITSLIDSFHYPRFGPGMMWERCETLLRDRGSSVHQGVRVERLRHHHRKINSLFGRTTGGEQLELPSNHVISTMPLRELVFALDPPPPEDILTAARQLRYRDYLTVVLIVKRPEVFPDNWLYIHSPQVRLGRIQNYKNWSPAMVPDPSCTSLGLEYFLWDQDEEWHWSQERLIALGIQECTQLGLIRADEVEDGTVVRMPKAYPVYDHDYHRHLSTIRDYLATFTNLQTIGRNGLHRYNNQDHSMLTGIYAARNLVGEHHDVWSVNTDTEYHEEQREARATTAERLVPVRVTKNKTHASFPEEILTSTLAKVDPLALGVAVGLVSVLTLFLMTTTLLVRGGPEVGPNLALLGHYLIGFTVSWTGAVVGAIEVGLSGFTVGYLGASLYNWSMTAYAAVVRRYTEAETY
ncbi:MAG: NAD(P)/FAD-dependent oxidoreductase [Candidatus Binatia bacterium]